MHHKLVLVIALALGPACSGTKRGQAMYRNDTQQVLESRSAQVKSCHDEALKVDPNIGGLVTVRFVVEKKTGAFVRPTIDPTKSDASEALVVCILNAINGLRLAPPDANEGQATFVYEFKATTPPT